jgi:hypothetical protein
MFAPAVGSVTCCTSRPSVVSTSRPLVSWSKRPHACQSSCACSGGSSSRRASYTVGRPSSSLCVTTSPLGLWKTSARAAAAAIAGKKSKSSLIRPTGCGHVVDGGAVLASGGAGGGGAWGEGALEGGPARRGAMLHAALGRRSESSPEFSELPPALSFVRVRSCAWTACPSRKNASSWAHQQRHCRANLVDEERASA